MQDRFEELKNNLLPRFWDTENKGMLYLLRYNSQLAYLNQDNGQCFLLEQVLLSPRLIPMNPTGLKDKKGNLIYDGDVIVGHNFDDNKTYFVVKYSDYHRRYIGTNKNECYDVSPTIFNKYSVIGNIYANPELL